MNREYNLTPKSSGFGEDANVILFKQIYSCFQHDASLKRILENLSSINKSYECSLDSLCI